MVFHSIDHDFHSPGLPGLQDRNRADSESENDDNNSDMIEDRSDDLENESHDRYYEIQHALRSKCNTDERTDTDENNECDRSKKSETWKERKQISIPEWKENNSNIDTNLYDGDDEEKKNYDCKEEESK